MTTNVFELEKIPDSNESILEVIASHLQIKSDKDKRIIRKWMN